MDMKQQRVFTKDNIGVTIDTVCFYRVINPQKSLYIVNDLVASIMQITFVSLRVVCGEYVLIIG
jgi:regulator of protease activity HflC (stomatin/prohibitin superfamily)